MAMFNPINYIKSLFIGRKNIKEAAKDEENPLARTIKRLGYHMRGSAARDDFITPEFDLYQVKDAYDTDCYIRQAFDRYIELMFKQGSTITYKDQRVKEYLSKRLVMLGDAMGQPVEHFWREISDDLVQYSNCFIVKKRVNPEDLPKMPGVTVRGLGKNGKPIGAYFRLAPQTMQIKVDANGTIKKYKQVVGQDEKEFKPVDIIHIAYKKPAGRFFGVPFVLPVLDDVRLLRKLEDNVAKLVYRHLYPLFVYKVGLDKPGYEASDGEIENMQEEIQNMPIDGGLVVPERHSIDLLTADETISAEKYLEYFEKRVFTGLGVSQTIMGRADTSNRSTAENQSSEMRDKVKAIQTVLENYINAFIIRELLMEGGFDPVLNPEQKAIFEFNEIDVDLKIKKENQAVYLFEHNCWTHEEMRQALGMEPVGDESRLHNNMFSELVTTGATDNKVNPQNSVNRVNITTSAYESRISSIHVELKNEVREIVNSYHNGQQSLEDAKEEMRTLFKMYQHKIGYYIELSAKHNYNKGITQASDGDSKLPGFDNYRNKISNKFTENSNQYIDKLLVLVEKETNIQSGIHVTCDWIESKIIDFIRETSIKAYNLGQYNTYQLNGINHLNYIASDGDVFTIENISDIPDTPVNLRANLREEGG